MKHLTFYSGARGSLAEIATMPGSQVRIPVDISLKEQQDIVDIYAKLREVEAKLVGPDGKTEALPNNLYSFLLRLLADLRAGHAMTILQSRHELTSIEASKILGMSRQYLVQLLERGELD